MSERVASLAFAVRPAVLGRHLGQIALGLAALTLVPLIASLLFGEYAFSWRLATVVIVLLLLGLPLRRLPAALDVQANEALSFVALAFLMAAVFMSFPLMASGLSFTDALFESISGVTTTGLSTAGDVEGRAQSFLFLRAWMQWYGGLGFAVLIVALLLGHHAAARRLVAEQAGDNLITTGRAHARSMAGVYLVLTALGFALLWIVLGEPFTALAHTLSGISTGGFSTFDQSLAGVDGWGARLTVIGFAFSGAVPLFLYYRAANGDWRKVARDPELHGLLFLALLVCVLLAGIMRYAGTGPDPLLHAAVMGFSAQSTTGFSSMDPAGLPAAAKLLLIASMIVGGGLGSTAGGIKVLRTLYVGRMLQTAVQRTALPPHAVLNVRLAGHRLSEDDLLRALLLLVLFAAVLFVSWAVFAAHGYPPLDALFEVTSATATVGLSTGLVGPDLEPALKLLLCANMLLGRVEILAFLILLYPRTWFGHRKGVT